MRPFLFLIVLPHFVLPYGVGDCPRRHLPIHRSPPKIDIKKFPHWDKLLPSSERKTAGKNREKSNHSPHKVWPVRRLNLRQKGPTQTRCSFPAFECPCRFILEMAPNGAVSIFLFGGNIKWGWLIERHRKKRPGQFRPAPGVSGGSSAAGTFGAGRNQGHGCGGTNHGGS